MHSGLSRWRLARIVLALAAMAAAALALLGCGSGGSRPSTSLTSSPLASSSLAAAKLTASEFTGSVVGNPLPSGFLGLSIEIKALEQYAGKNPAAIDPVLVRLIGQIAPHQSPVLRLGGDSSDWSWWPVARVARPPGVRYTLTPTWMHVAHALATDLRAHLILGVDLEADSPAVASAEAQAMVGEIGRGSIEALELGNEPELYGSFGWYRSASGKSVTGRPRGYDVADFIHDYSSIAPRLPGDLRLAGPSSGAAMWLSQLGSFLGAEPRVGLATVHAYPLKQCSRSTVVTIPELLSGQSTAGLAAQVAPYVVAAARHRTPLRVDEMNGISCGGTRGVSNTFTSALWVLDTLFGMDRAGVAGVNVQTVPGSTQEVLGPEFVDGGWRIRVHPEYYGMIMFAQAAPLGSRLLRLSSAPPPAGVKLWATRAPGGSVHVVVINKRLAATEVVRLRLPQARGQATVEQLRAPSVHATGGVTIGGQSFGATTGTGVLSGPATNDTLSPSAGVYTVRVPAASATMLTLSAR